jgi:hypothetical protein
MNNTLNATAKFLAYIFAVLFVITLIAALFLYNLEKKAFDAESYKIALAESNFYEQLPTLIAEQFVANTEGEANNFAFLIENIGTEDQELLIAAILPPDDVQKLTEETIDQSFDFLNGNINTASISFYPIKENLNSEETVDTIIAIFEAQPPCTISDVLAFATGEIPFCNPPEKTQVLLKPFIQSELATFAYLIPDQKVFLERSNLNKDFADFQSMRVLMRLSPLLPILFLLLVTILVVRSAKTWLSWWGIPLLIAGFTSFLLTFLIEPVIQLLLNTSLRNMELPASVLELLKNLLQTIVHGFIENIVLYAIIFAILGAIMALSSKFIKPAEAI